MHEVGEHWVNAHVAEHTPELQNGEVVGQAVPQVPQFVALVCVSTQLPAQVVSGAAQAHCEA